MAEKWREINDPGIWRKQPESEGSSKPNTSYDDSPPEGIVFR